jgi:hypothetical protein
MPKIISTLLACFLLMQSFGQHTKKFSTYISAQYNKTISDRTLGNNPWGAGLGLQAFFNNKSKIKASIDLTGDLYLEDDKVLRTNETGKEVNSVDGMINLFAGASFHPTGRVYVSVVTGPSFIGSQVLAGIKPSVGFYFSATQRLTGKISYINIFNRDKPAKEDFGSLSLSLGLRLF